jgi:hypothetical protein
MALEYFNYDRKRSGNFLVSSDYAVMTLIAAGDSAAPGAIAKALMQDTNIQYNHRVNIVPEMGSHEVYFISGQAQGQATISRAVGQGGLMEGVHPGGQGTLNKGAIASMQMEVSSADTASPGTAQEGLEFNNVIKTSGTVLRGVQWQVSANNLTLMESMDIIIASLVLDR